MAERGPGTQPALWAAARAFLSSPQCLTLLQTHKAALVRPLRVSVSARLLKNTHTLFMRRENSALYGNGHLFSPTALSHTQSSGVIQQSDGFAWVLLWLLLSARVTSARSYQGASPETSQRRKSTFLLRPKATL